MIKYFIENSQGEWLRDLEHSDASVTSCWTRDPNKAWGFNKSDNPEDNYCNYDANGGRAVRQSAELLWFLQKEAPDTTTDLKITEHEFIDGGIGITV